MTKHDSQKQQILRNRNCLSFGSTWAHPRFFGGVHVAHLFLFCDFCIICLLCLISMVACFSEMSISDYPFCFLYRFFTYAWGILTFVLHMPEGYWPSFYICLRDIDLRFTYAWGILTLALHMPEGYWPSF